MIKKIILMFIFIVLLTGCTAEYNLNINKDFIIDEDIIIRDSIFSVKKQNLDVDSFVELNVDGYKSDPRYSMYMYEKVVDNSYAKVIAKTTYLDFLSYKQNNIVKASLFDTFNIINNGNTYIFAYKLKPRDEIKIFEEEDLYGSLIDEVKINITLPFEVTSNNADKVNLDTGTYTWKYSKNGVLKDINLEFNANKMSLGRIAIGLYFVLGFAIILLVIFGYAFYKYKSHNRV